MSGGESVDTSPTAGVNGPVDTTAGTMTHSGGTEDTPVLTAGDIVDGDIVEDDAGVSAGGDAGEMMVSRDLRAPEDMDMGGPMLADEGPDLQMDMDLITDPSEWCVPSETTSEEINGVAFTWRCIHGANRIFQVMTHELNSVQIKAMIQDQMVCETPASAAPLAHYCQRQDPYRDDLDSEVEELMDDSSHDLSDQMRDDLVNLTLDHLPAELSVRDVEQATIYLNNLSLDYTHELVSQEVWNEIMRGVEHHIKCDHGRGSNQTLNGTFRGNSPEGGPDDADHGCGFNRPRSVDISVSEPRCIDHVNARLDVFREDRHQGDAELCDLEGNMREIIKSVDVNNNATYYQTQLGWRTPMSRDLILGLDPLMNHSQRAPDLGARLVRVKLLRSGRAP
jgi:hypothetical protein